MRCGALFAAVRIPVELVYAAAGAREVGAVDRYLGEVLAGPAFLDTYWQHYWALVHPGAAGLWRDEGIACLGTGTEVEVPHPRLTDCGDAGCSYWAVPPRRPGHLCASSAVLHLVMYGRHRLVVDRGGEGR
ncbi:hypothetical protein CUT44_31160 [Streptomyces carminius]|uniref:Uncharacterized protein n=1 Tax=Streptomyces carminius TaxID=2665496 RepID=A0A2M8LP51_9ACTN|nr:hypothetical protein CUT44_31160 [Streptomyces carminius]